MLLDENFFSLDNKLFDEFINLFISSHLTWSAERLDKIKMRNFYNIAYICISVLDISIDNIQIQ